MMLVQEFVQEFVRIIYLRVALFRLLWKRKA